MCNASHALGAVAAPPHFAARFAAIWQEGARGSGSHHKWLRPAVLGIAVPYVLLGVVFACYSTQSSGLKPSSQWGWSATAGVRQLAMAMAQATSSWCWLATRTLAGANVCSDGSSKSPRLRKYRVLRCQNGQLRPADLGSAVPSSQMLLVACMYTAGGKKVKSTGRYAAKMGSLGQQILVLLCHRHSCYWWHVCTRLGNERQKSQGVMLPKWVAWAGRSWFCRATFMTVTG